MVQILAPLFGALLFSGVMAAPRPDSSINEPAVSSPNGIPITEGAPIGTPAVKAYMAPMATTSAMMAESTSAKMMEESSSKMMMESSSAKMMMESSSAKMMMEATSTMMEEATSTMMMEATSTMPPATSTMYGSGSSGSSGYDNCVMQCMNTYGAPAAQYTPPPSTATDSGSGSGSGKVHTVIVAPMKGVLRFVPFAVNASVGDTIHYVWGAGPHTVTRSSVLEPCNKTTDASAFNSGQRNATATFDQAVNDTNPLFFYCNVPGHCQKGMFGIVNPPSAPLTATTVAQMMPQWIANSTTIATLAMYTNNQTKGTSAANWGDSIDVATVPTWAHAALAENVMYTRLLFAANPGMLEAGAGAGYPDGKPYSLPSANFDTLLAATPDSVPAANAQAPASSSDAAPSATSASAASAASPTESKKSGASAVSSSALLVGVIAVAATFFAL